MSKQPRHSLGGSTAIGHSTEGITVPADQPQRAMTRVCFRGCRTFLGGSVERGTQGGKQERVPCTAGGQRSDASVNERDFIKDSGELCLGRVRF